MLELFYAVWHWILLIVSEKSERHLTAFEEIYIHNEGSWGDSGIVSLYAILTFALLYRWRRGPGAVKNLLFWILAALGTFSYHLALQLLSRLLALIHDLVTSATETDTELPPDATDQEKSEYYKQKATARDCAIEALARKVQNLEREKECQKVWIDAAKKKAQETRLLNLPPGCPMLRPTTISANEEPACVYYNQLREETIARKRAEEAAASNMSSFIQQQELRQKEMARANMAEKTVTELTEGLAKNDIRAGHEAIRKLAEMKKSLADEQKAHDETKKFFDEANQAWMRAEKLSESSQMKSTNLEQELLSTRQELEAAKSSKGFDKLDRQVTELQNSLKKKDTELKQAQEAKKAAGERFAAADTARKQEEEGKKAAQKLANAQHADLKAVESAQKKAHEELDALKKEKAKHEADCRKNKLELKSKLEQEGIKNKNLIGQAERLQHENQQLRAHQEATVRTNESEIERKRAIDGAIEQCRAQWQQEAQQAIQVVTAERDAAIVEGQRLQRESNQLRSNQQAASSSTNGEVQQLRDAQEAARVEIERLGQENQQIRNRAAIDVSMAQEKYNTDMAQHQRLQDSIVDEAAKERRQYQATIFELQNASNNNGQSQAQGGTGLNSEWLIKELEGHQTRINEQRARIIDLEAVVEARGDEITGLKMMEQLGESEQETEKFKKLRKEVEVLEMKLGEERGKTDGLEEDLGKLRKELKKTKNQKWDLEDKVDEMKDFQAKAFKKGAFTPRAPKGPKEKMGM